MSEKKHRKTRIKMILLVSVFVSAILNSNAVCADASEAVKEQQRNLLVRVVTISQDGLLDKPGKPMLDATLTRLNRAASFRFSRD